MTTRSVPESVVIEWPPSAANVLHLRHELAENPLLEYALHVDEDARLDGHVVFLRKSKPSASCRGH